ncbi:sigma-70 family RNA polymerase sigma factor [uncultured Chitinophaga sp.]|jgi:RNA polymerase sigma factor, sigma-70 family|uniref:RNA polymerase sigma factor n=1 Tax=uncultured Chitinophaga sp. TaxID=339340 RepID=UPI00262A900A|nr:sigma-70 family RNA polymerase sigma factor [uncultured Chitinophaga sp.]
MSSQEDIVLLERLKAGQAEALSDLFVKYRKQLLTVAIGILEKDHEMEAQDLVQDIFVAFWEKQHFLKIGPPFNVKGYLIKIVYYKCLDFVEHQKVHRHRMQRIQENLPVIFSENYLENKELKLQIHAAIRQIPPGRAKVFELTYLEHKSRNEIANLLGTSPNTVKNQLVAAVREIRKILQNNLAH